MKIKPISPTSIVKKVAKPVKPEKVSEEGIARMKALMGDEFYRYDITTKLVKRRNVPNWIGTEEDYKDALPTPQEYIDFYPEDKEKLEKMTIDQKIEYTAHLIDIGRCFTVQGIKPIPPDILEKYCK